MTHCGIWPILGLVMALQLPGGAEEPPAPHHLLPDFGEAIPGPVKALADPLPRSFPGGIEMAVSTRSPKAQLHVTQGLNHLHGGWEFEASRHFAVALREDPNCLLAHWGMVMSLLNPATETNAARMAATERMLALLDAGQGTEIERGYAYGLIKYWDSGPSAAANAMRKVAHQFPNDLQAAVFAALFSRGGFDADGEPTPDQEAAEKILLDLIQRHPQSPIPLNALLIIRAEGPHAQASVEQARQLTRMLPDYPPAQHLLGHFLWRSGQHRDAAGAFESAAAGYAKWMSASQATLADCPEWIKAESYRVVALASQGDFTTADAAARKLADIRLPEKRPDSPGMRMWLWEATSLPARLLLQRGQVGDAVTAARSLPKPSTLTATRKHCLAYWWLDGLRFALEAQRLLDQKDLEGARQASAALTQHGEAMAKTQVAAAAAGERSPWIRAFIALEVMASDVRGRVAMAGPADRRGSAYNWFSAAADRQRPATLLWPPVLLTPMLAHLGDYYISVQKPAEAIDAYQRALVAFPNDLYSLRGLQRAFEAAGKPDEAAAVKARLDGR